MRARSMRCATRCVPTAAPGPPAHPPRPLQAHLPILIGGSGPTKTLRTTARYADLWNGFGPPDRIAQLGETLRGRCAEVGRPFDEIERTVTVHVVVRDTVEAATAAWD